MNHSRRLPATVVRQVLVNIGGHGLFPSWHGTNDGRQARNLRTIPDLRP